VRELHQPIWIEKNEFEIGIGNGCANFILQRFDEFGGSLLNILICDD
jgi:hypothetical protein